ncbi:hypothetical protein BN7_103 [Wickerhamomyces ciferrii]|uniref:Uncharacterized protein n=1 Tax=Wickerhamomyces ciferrii (strain ATCC 14091 / BCRC 22168 / CBS 111 / JCM 3599 / NBRC 0793 / NRRL Y-1031 F-60-10) TaxID=1206466 RepID=K0K6M1_WICCF|nr:uncharacterized protein BN7_103 [Wickerhamomyces ciferrii]CCH40570.1 hypothetical protein BN7_103 [Wickerhamomyces ciferrii]
MSQLPPSNSDPGIDILRAITLEIYPLIFNSFKFITLITSNYSKLSSKLTHKTLRDDIQWIKESMDQDILKLNNLQNHLNFINSQETITNKNEILTVFNEITDFAQLILLDDLITTLEGISTTLTPQDIDILKINELTMNDIVSILKRFSISLKITCDPLKLIERNTITTEDISIPLSKLKNIIDTVEERKIVLQQKFEDLKKVVQ